MKKLLLLFALFAVALSATASPTERWLDPECFAENRAPMRTSFIVFPTASEAVPENDYTRSPFYRTLNGEWAFLRAERPGAEPEGFFRTGYDDSSWGVMPVPGIWELNGYGDPVYTNKPYPWYKFFEVKPPLVPHEQNYTGLYRRTVRVPADWKGRDAFIHIGSATSNVTLWVNGREVGYSEDSKLEAEFDVTRYITPGRDNLIVLRINRWCDGSYLEDQDFWRLSGIGRDCYLYARDKRRLADVRLTPDLVNDYRDGTLRAEVTATPGVGSVRLTLRDDEGRTLDTHAPSPPQQRRNAVRGRRPETMERRGPESLHAHGRGSRRRRFGDRSRSFPRGVPQSRDPRRTAARKRQADPHQRRQPARNGAQHGLLCHTRGDGARHPRDEAAQHKCRAHVPLP